MVLRRQVTRRFGEATAGELSDLLDELTRPAPTRAERSWPAFIEQGTEMKILREGDRGYALAPERGRVEMVYEYRTVELEYRHSW